MCVRLLAEQNQEIILAKASHLAQQRMYYRVLEIFIASAGNAKATEEELIFIENKDYLRVLRRECSGCEGACSHGIEEEVRSKLPPAIKCCCKTVVENVEI